MIFAKTKGNTEGINTQTNEGETRDRCSQSGIMDQLQDKDRNKTKTEACGLHGNYKASWEWRSCDS